MKRFISPSLLLALVAAASLVAKARVLRLLADGLSNEEIGKRLFLSPETVRTHVQKAMRRLEADTRTQAVALALRQSIIG
jgi:DNA-binding NarL/FixJ family response regulator